MTEAVAVHGAVEPAETPLTPESWGKLGMWLFLAGDAMSFGGLIVAYGALRYHSKSWPVPGAGAGHQPDGVDDFLAYRQQRDHGVGLGGTAGRR